MWRDCKAGSPRDLKDAYYRDVTTPVDILIRKGVSNAHATGLLQAIAFLSGGTAAKPAPQNAQPAKRENSQESAKPQSEIEEEPLRQ